MNDARAGKRSLKDGLPLLADRILVPMRRRVVLAALCAASILIGSTDVAVATIVRPGGAVFGGRVITQIDGRTFVVDIGGPAKEGALRGHAMVRADRATRFNLMAGLRGVTLYGSLEGLRIGPTTPIAVELGGLLSDGSYRLLALTTITR